MACSQNVDEQLNCLQNGQIVVFLRITCLVFYWVGGGVDGYMFYTVLSGLLV